MNHLKAHLPVYNSKPIRLLSSLAKALGLTEAALNDLANRANTLYRTVEIKDKGKTRITYDAHETLKSVQHLINTQILNKVEFPEYLTGAIKKRDYKFNASLHTEARVIICEDISQFFPSIKAEKIYDVWRYLFKFSEPVAQCLTNLTTLNGILPQGAKTSAALSNLILWRDEPQLFKYFHEQGLVYSRYIDDMSVSSKTFLTDDMKTAIIARIYKVLMSNGYQPNRKKHELKTSRERMVATKLTVNSQAESLSQLEQARIRAAVKELEIIAQNLAFHEKFEDMFRSTIGRVNAMARFHKPRASALKERLNTVKSTYNEFVKKQTPPT